MNYVHHNFYKKLKSILSHNELFSIPISQNALVFDEVGRLQRGSALQLVLCELITVIVEVVRAALLRPPKPKTRPVIYQVLQINQHFQFATAAKKVPEISVSIEMFTLVVKCVVQSPHVAKKVARPVLPSTVTKHTATRN